MSFSGEPNSPIATVGDQRLLVTKLAPPRRRTDHLVRARLLDALEAGSDCTLTLVSTPPGYGKTTLAQQWASSGTRPVGWVSLDESDNDPVVFFQYFVAAVQSIDDQLCPESAMLVSTPTPTPVKTIVASLINEMELATRPFTIALDDYHLVDLEEIHEGISRLIRNAPPMLRLLFATRSDPPLPLMRMRANRDLRELRAEELAFTVEETTHLLRHQFEIDISADQISAIHDRTEGWPAGILLIGQTLQGQGQDRVATVLAQSNRSNWLVEGYLWTELLDRLEPEKRAFLLQTSILTQFNADLCNHLLQSESMSQMVKQLEDENLFLIALQGGGRWYRYHHLFAGALRSMLYDTYPAARLRELHRLAAQWFRLHGDTESAARHAISGADWDTAIALLRSLCGELTNRERISAVRSWLELVPVEIIARHPELCHWLGWAYMRTGQVQEARPLLAMAEKAWTAANDSPGTGRALEIRIMEDVLMQNVDQGLERCARALELLEPGDIADQARVHIMQGYLHVWDGDIQQADMAFARGSSLAQRIGNRPIHLVSQSGIGLSLQLRGKLRESVALLERVVAVGDEWNDLAVQNALTMLAAAHLEWMDLESAALFGERGLMLSERMSTPVHQVRLHRVLGQIAWAKGDADGAFSAFDRVVELAGRAGQIPEVRIARALTADVRMAMGHAELARGWLAGSELDSGGIPAYTRHAEMMTMVRLISLDGRRMEAATVLGGLEEPAERNGRFGDLVGILSLRAVIESEIGHDDGAVSIMERALTIGAPEGFTRSYLAEGERLIRPLELIIRGNGDHHRYARKLLDQLKSLGGLEQHRSGGPVPFLLSGREIEVLQLVARGQSNRDIADKLFIAEQTVKKHLSNMFVKMDVSSRTQAIERGRRSGIL